MKSPVYLGPVFLEKPERVHALGYVFMLVLLVASYLEYRVRKGLKETEQAVLLPGNKKTQRPSTQTIMEIFGLIEVLIIGGERYFPETLQLQAMSMVRWAGYDPYKLYLVISGTAGLRPVLKTVRPLLLAVAYYPRPLLAL